MRRAGSVFFLALLLAAAIAAPSAAVADPLTSWTAGPNAILDDTYTGYIDVPAMNANVPTGGFNVSGWFFDTTAEGWAGADDMQLWLGTMDGGGKLLTHLNFAQNRPDVAAAVGNPSAAASGFGGTVPAGGLAAGPQTLSVYAHTPGKGWWFKQVQVNVTGSAPAATAASTGGGGLPTVVIEKPKDSEVVLTKNDYEISGFALDKNATSKSQGVGGSGVNRVQVWIGPRDDPSSTYLGDATLGYESGTAVSMYGDQFASSGWRLTFQPTDFHANTYLVYAYARSAVTGKEDSVSRYFAIREQAP
jgi:hypothetical protein